jgi:hypothetical protein
LDLRKCPFCGSHQIFPGSIKSGKTHLFKPRDVRVPHVNFAEAEGIPFGPHAELCARCGLLWTHADPKQGRKFLEAYGSPKAIEILSESTAGAAPSDIRPPGPAPT